MKRRLQGFAIVWLGSMLGLLPAAARADDDSKIKIGLKSDATVAHDPKWEVATFRTNGGIFDTWSNTRFNGTASSLALVTIDATIRGHLKIPANQGLLVQHVAPQSPSWHAGIRNQDILLTAGDSPVANPGDLSKKLKEAGEKPISLTLLRGGEKKTIRVQPRVEIGLGPIPSEQPVYMIGVTTTPVDPLLRSQLKLPEGQGLTIREIDPESPAAKANLAIGDILLTLEAKPVDREQTLYELVQASEGKPISLELIHEGSKKSISLTPVQRIIKATPHPDGGAVLRYVTSDNGSELHPSGIVVGVRPGTPAAAFVSGSDVEMVREGSPVAQGATIGRIDPQRDGIGTLLKAPFVLRAHPTPEQIGKVRIVDSMKLEASPKDQKAASPDPVAKRLDEMSTQIDSLRKSIEELAKAIKEKK